MYIVSYKYANSKKRFLLNEQINGIILHEADRGLSHVHVYRWVCHCWTYEMKNCKRITWLWFVTFWNFALSRFYNLFSFSLKIYRKISSTTSPRDLKFCLSEKNDVKSEQIHCYIHDSSAYMGKMLKRGEPVMSAPFEIARNCENVQCYRKLNEARWGTFEGRESSSSLYSH